MRPIRSSSQSCAPIARRPPPRRCAKLDADDRSASTPQIHRAPDAGSSNRRAEQFKHDTTAKLVADLTAFVDPDPKKGLLADVRGRLAFAESVEQETIGKYETKWADAIRSIADRTECPKYDGSRSSRSSG